MGRNRHKPQNQGIHPEKQSDRQGMGYFKRTVFRACEGAKKGVG